MILAKLTRFPGCKMPEQALTSHGTLNAYLAELDSKLLGSAAVRMQTLAEVRDHLEEKVRYFVDAGHNEHEAAALAVQAMSVNDQVAAQRAALLKKFIRTGVPAGLASGVLMAAMWSSIPYVQDHLAIYWLLWLAAGAVFSLYFGWIMAFVMPDRRLPSGVIAELTATGGSTFVVAYGRTMRRMSYFLAVAFMLAVPGSVAIGLAKLLDLIPPDMFLFPWWLFFLLAPLCAFDVKMVALGGRRYEVRDDGLVVKEFLRKPKLYPFERLVRLGTLGEVRKWLPYYWKRVRYAEFDLGKRKPTRLLIFNDMLNADRLFVMLQAQLNTRHDSRQ
jgi:hypothetical protein